VTDHSAVAAPRTRRWLWAVGYLSVLGLATGLGALAFLAGGIALILIPGSLPVWAEVGYIVVGAVGSVAIGLLATNQAFRRLITAAPPAQRPAATARARALRFIGSLAGAVAIAIVAAVVRVLVVRLLESSGI
jgi:hypothetical protein